MAQRDAAFWLHKRIEKGMDPFSIFFIRLYYLYHEDLVSLLHFEVGDKCDKLMPSKIFPSKTAAGVQESSMQEVRHQRPTLLPGWPTHLAWLVL